MPRPKSSVKNKTRQNSPKNRRLTGSIQSLGAVDLHFHGAFGIDLMTATGAQMTELSHQLWENGVAAFCPTTLSLDRHALLAAVSRIGAWTSELQGQARSPRKQAPRGAIPLGLHLEGPFIHPHACGAHPPSAIRSFDFEELDQLWTGSRGTLKILTLAPETLPPETVPRLFKWAHKKKITLSLGHSRATEAQARDSFEAGFTNVTHAWNAMPFHQRSPGPLGAALGSPGVFLELIIDGAHVAPTVIRWTLLLHSPERTCFVSDCVPAAALPVRPSGDSPDVPFGPLQIRFRDGACRLENGTLAGGGLLLPEAYRRWALAEAMQSGAPLELLKRTLTSLSDTPLRSLSLDSGLLRFLRTFRKVRWQWSNDGPRPRKDVRAAQRQAL